MLLENPSLKRITLVEKKRFLAEIRMKTGISIRKSNEILQDFIDLDKIEIIEEE